MSRKKVALELARIARSLVGISDELYNARTNHADEWAKKAMRIFKSFGVSVAGTDVADLESRIFLHINRIEAQKFADVLLSAHRALKKAKGAGLKKMVVHDDFEITLEFDWKELDEQLEK